MSISAPLSTRPAADGPDLSQQPIFKQAITDLPFAELNSAFNSPVKSWEGESCTICLEDYETGQFVRIIPCGHFNHADCIMEMIVGMPGVSKCAECRAPIFAKEQHDRISRERLDGVPSLGDFDVERLIGGVEDQIRNIVMYQPWGEAAGRPQGRVPGGYLVRELQDYPDLLWDTYLDFVGWFEDVYENNPTHYSVEAVRGYLFAWQFRWVYHDMNLFFERVQEQHGIPRPYLERWDELFLTVIDYPLPEVQTRDGELSLSTGPFAVVRPGHRDPYSVVLRPVEALLQMSVRLGNAAAEYQFPQSIVAEVREIFFRLGDALNAFVMLLQPFPQGPGQAGRDPELTISIGEREIAYEVDHIYRDLVAFFLRTERALDIVHPADDFPANILNFIVREDGAQPDSIEETVARLPGYLEGHPHLMRPPTPLLAQTRSEFLVGIWRLRSREV